MVQQKHHLLKEQLSTLRSLSGYVLSMLEGPKGGILFDGPLKGTACCDYEELFESIVVEDCTDLGTLMIKGLIRIQKKLKQQQKSMPGDCSTSVEKLHSGASLCHQKKQVDEEDLSSEKEVTTTGIFDSLAQAAMSNSFLNNQVEAIEIKSEGEDDIYENPGFHLNHTSLSNFETATSYDSKESKNVTAFQDQDEKKSDTETNSIQNPLCLHTDNSGGGKRVSKEGENVGKRYECSLCGKVLACYKNLIRHRKVHKDSGKYTCKYCWKVFTSEYSLKKHMCAYAPVNQQPFICSSCGKKFSMKSDLDGHMLVHGGRKPYNCTLCEANFVSLFEYQVHLDSHRSEKEFRCETCDKVFTTSKSLQRHRYLHSSQKPYPCQHCDKEFVTSFDLKKHALCHISQTGFVCEVCNKSYSNEDSLKRHVLLHKQPSSKVHACEKCGNTFALLSDLEEHLKMVHPVATSEASNLEPTRTVKETSLSGQMCSICGKQYSSRRNLIRHKLLHNRGNQQPCPICSKKFINSIDLRRHISCHRASTDLKKPSINISVIDSEQKPTNNDDFTIDDKLDRACQLCRKVFKARKYLKQHQVIHRDKPYCSCCEQYFLNQQQYNAHKDNGTCRSPYPIVNAKTSVQIAEDGTKKHLCAICQKEFGSSKSIRKHMLLHDEKYFCGVCKRFFVSAEVYKKHVECHASGEDLSCDVCHKVFSTRSNLHLHRRLHQRHKLHICSICNKGFATPSSFTKHARTHTIERPRGNSISLSHSTMANINFPGDQTISATPCTQSFNPVSDGNNICESLPLKMHAGSEANSFDSRAFDETYVTSDRLIGDPNHTEEDPIHSPVFDNFRCGECFMLFDSSFNLREHILNSTCSSYNCLACGEYLRSQKELDLHQCRGTSMSSGKFTAEEGEVNIDDTEIREEGGGSGLKDLNSVDFHSDNLFTYESDANYSQDDSLSLTMESGTSSLTFDTNEVSDIDDVIYRCRACKTTFETKQELQTHKPQCSLSGCFECSTCGKLFDNPKRLRIHKLQHLDNAQKPWKCELCHKGFVTKSHLRRHELIHSAEKKFICDICGKGFIRNDMLKSHLKKQH